MFIPIWLLIPLICVLGWAGTAWFIGDPHGDILGIAAILHLLNIMVWLTALLAALLIRSWLG